MTAPNNMPQLGPTFFNALCWTVQTTFPEDLEKGLIELGAAPVTADEIRWAYAAMRNRNILKFYEDYAYAGSHREWQKLLAAYIERSVSFYVQRFAPPAAKGITEGCRVRVTLPGPMEGKEGTATWDASASKWEVRFDPTWCGWYDEDWLEVAAEP